MKTKPGKTFGRKSLALAKYKLLILTDHAVHSADNSLYALARSLRRHPLCRRLEVASRGFADNDAFFKNHQTDEFWVSEAADDFAFDPSGKHFKTGWKKSNLGQYDGILLRLPHPISEPFFDFLTRRFPEQKIINRPSGILKTSSKAFLLEVPELCPPMQLCRNWDEIEAFSKNFPIVLKPLRGYGGKGIFKIENGEIWEGDQPVDRLIFEKFIRAGGQEFLGMQYMKNVYEGDKRILVVNGKVLGASLRLPRPGSWMCNISQGGHSRYADADAGELEIAHRLSQKLLPLGVVIFGFDTLADDDGRRLLSEVNVLSIGGIAAMQQESGRPVMQQTADLLWDYFLENI